MVMRMRLGATSKTIFVSETNLNTMKLLVQKCWAQKMLGLIKISSLKIFLSLYSSSPVEVSESPTKIGSDRNFVSEKKCLVGKNAQKNFLSEKILSPKKFWI